MPVTDNGFERYTQDEIYTRLVSEFESRFDASVESGDLVKRQFESLAQTLYENQERALEQVYKSAYIQSATGDELEKLVARLGLERRTAVPATGVIEVFRDSIPSATYTVPSGTIFQTKGSDPIQFESTSTARLARIDSFDDGDLSEYTGDVGDWDIQSGELVKPTTSGSTIRYTNREFTKGTTFNFDVRCNADTSIGFRFGIESSDTDFYEAVIDEYSSELRIDVYENGSTIDSNSVSVNIPSDTNIHAEIEYGVWGDHAIRLYESDSRSTEINSVSVSGHREYRTGLVGFTSNGSTANVYIDDLSNTHDTANIEAVSGGVDTNLTEDTVTQATESITGVDGQTNPLAVGDSTYIDVAGSSFVQGRDRETDEQLRERAFESTIIGGSATISAIKSAIRDIEHVDSLTLYYNKTENTDGDGMPPHSFEATVYYNGPDEDIARALFETKSIDSSDVGGIHGTETTYDIESDVLATTETVHWSSIPETTTDITLTLITDDTYVGDDEIKSRIVNYIGGIDLGGERVSGLNVGDDLYVGVLKDVIVGPSDTGVWDVDSITIDITGDGSDDTETLSNGAEAVSVDNNQVLTSNARDGSISITTVDK